MADGTYRRLASAVLIAHQRRADTSCLCGWADLGRSWADHVAERLEAVGALRDRPPPVQVQLDRPRTVPEPGSSTAVRRTRQET